MIEHEKLWFNEFPYIHVPVNLHLEVFDLVVSPSTRTSNHSLRFSFWWWCTSMCTFWLCVFLFVCFFHCFVSVHSKRSGDTFRGKGDAFNGTRKTVLTCLPLCLFSSRMQELRRELVKGIGCRVIVCDQRPWHEVNNNDSALVGIEISADRQVWMIPPETRLKDHE